MLFIVDNRPEAGLGHVTRCGALSDEMKLRGWECSGGGLNSGSKSRVDIVVIDVGLEGRMTRRQSVVPMVPGEFKIVTIVDEPSPWEGWDLLVCGSAGANISMFDGCLNQRALIGPEYALLRREFRRRVELRESTYMTVSLRPPVELDLRNITDQPAEQIAGRLYDAYVCSDVVLTYGGMRALEARCVLGPEHRGELRMEARNYGEELNVAGLWNGAVIDGLGCQRVADAIESL